MSQNKTWDISAGGSRELDQKLSEYYGVDEIWHQGDFDDGEGGYYMEVLLCWDGDDEHLIAEDVPVYGHGPSGAMGCYEDDLPDKERVREKVEKIHQESLD